MLTPPDDLVANRLFLLDTGAVAQSADLRSPIQLGSGGLQPVARPAYPRFLDVDCKYLTMLQPGNEILPRQFIVWLFLVFVTADRMQCAGRSGIVIKTIRSDQYLDGSIRRHDRVRTSFNRDHDPRTRYDIKTVTRILNDPAP